MTCPAFTSTVQGLACPFSLLCSNFILFIFCAEDILLIWRSTSRRPQRVVFLLLGRPVIPSMPEPSLEPQNRDAPPPVQALISPPLPAPPPPPPHNDGALLEQYLEVLRQLLNMQSRMQRTQNRMNRELRRHHLAMERQLKAVIRQIRCHHLWQDRRLLSVMQAFQCQSLWVERAIRDVYSTMDQFMALMGVRPAYVGPSQGQNPAELTGTPQEPEGNVPARKDTDMAA